MLNSGEARNKSCRILISSIHCAGLGNENNVETRGQRGNKKPGMWGGAGMVV